MEVLGHGSGQVWIENHPTEGWSPGRVDSVLDGGKYLVVDEEGQKFEIAQNKLMPIADTACLKGVDDLLGLGDFNEGALLHNIRVRYFKDDIYTGIGGPILISVNPYANLPGIYSEAKQKFYRDRGLAIAQGLDEQIPPHLFSVGDAAYRSMLAENCNQSIIISGESGAGKTEATKRILIYFVGLQQNQAPPAQGSETLSIEQQVLRSNPILEGFGNAKTIRNDNSSRFGKFIEIEFDNVGKLQSARISNYLLEKCRIVTQQPNERNYHAFYQLCAGASSLGPLCDVLHLNDSGDHSYTSVCPEIVGVDDGQEFSEMSDCMQSLGFTTEERNSVFKVVAAVLHLGDLEFQEQADSADGTKIVDEQKAGWICECLNVDLKDFIKVFQYKTLEDPFSKKIIDMPQDVASSSNTRHSMAKVAYSRLFDWLVWRINQSTMSKALKKDSRKIGILDIFGFEIFEWNSFEQLCINFANEKLQQHFNSHMFTLEQRLYTEEGISWGHIEFQDNREIIDTLERKPLGLFPLFDSECLMPNATDQTCLSKIYNSFKTSKIVKKPDRFASTNFAVAHYAGEVVYDIISFLEKNTDKLHADILNLLKGSKMPLLKTLFSDPKFAPEAGGDAAGKSAPKRASAPAGGGRAKQNTTVSMMFRMQLDTLVEDLNKTAPRYIRCIKPNPNKQAHEFESIDIMRQLRCAGMLESIRIRKAGYSVRRVFKEFYNRFRVLCPHLSTAGKADPDFKELSRKILQDVESKLEKEGKPLAPKSWQVGRSKVFLKDELQAQMEKRIGDAIKHYVLKVQKVWRGFRQKKRYRNMKRAVVKVQAGLLTLKAATEFKAYQRKMQSALVLQAALRMAPCRITFVRRRAGALKIQKIFRGWRCRQKVGKLKGKMAQDRIQRMREEETRNEALQNAQKAAEEKAKAMEDMQQQMALERERFEEEARRKLEEQQKQRTEEVAVPSKEQQERLQREQEQAENLRQELLDMRKENARLQGQLDCQASSKSGSTSDAEVEQLRRELSDARREKARMEVELATSKSSKEYDAILAEANQLREDASQLRRAKLDAELQLEQKSTHLETLQARLKNADQQASELSSLRGLNDELQVQVQRLQAQKSTLEDRVQNEEASRVELTNLRLEKMRLEGDLETSRMREEAMSDKMKESDERSVEMHQHKQKVMTAEVELDAARRQIEKLKEQVAEMSKDGSDKRNASLDQLRSELLGRIESKPISSARPSILPPSGATEGRATLMNQRAIFEQLKQQFNDSKVEVDETPLPTAEVSTREFELEDELRHTKKENVELNIRISSLEDELKLKGGEAGHLIQGHGLMAAEIQDLKFQVEQEASAVSRLTQENGEFQALLIERESEANTLRRQKTVAEERLVQAEEDRDAVRQKVMRIEEDREAFEQRCRQLQLQISDAAAREAKLQSLYEEQRAWAERYQKIAEDADRKRAEGEIARDDAESERERLKIELSDANYERAKIKQVVDEVMAQGGKNEELDREVEKWKARSAHFEQEYANSKQLNTEMTKVMSQMTQSMSERSENNSDAVKQNKILFKQLEASKQAERTARLEKEDMQKQLDSLQSTGSYFQDKYKEASNEIRTLKQETSVASASLSKMKVRVESLQKENEDLKAQMGKMSHEIRASCSDSVRVEQYEHTVKELQTQLSKKAEDLDSTQSMFAKSQQVNDCLNTLLVLETEQKGLYEKIAPVADTVVARELQEKRSKTDHVISRLNQIMQDDEKASRPSILDHSFRY